MLVKSNRFSRNASLEASPGKESRMSKAEPNHNSSVFDRERQDRQSSVFGGG